MRIKAILRCSLCIDIVSTFVTIMRVSAEYELDQRARETRNRGHLPIFHCLHAVALRDSVVHDNVFILDNFWQLFKQILNIQEIGSYDEPVKRPIARCVPIFIAVNKTATVVSRSSPIVEADGLPQCDEELLARIIV